MLRHKRQKATKAPRQWCAHPPFGRFVAFGRTLTALETRCPELVPVARWQQCVDDGRTFLTRWGEQAEALGWTARDLFGLFPVPENRTRHSPIIPLRPHRADLAAGWPAGDRPHRGHGGDTEPHRLHHNLPQAPMSRAGTFKQRDVTRAVKAAAAAGLHVAGCKIESTAAKSKL